MKFRKDIVMLVCSSGGHLSECLSACEKVAHKQVVLTKKDRHVKGRIGNRRVHFVHDPHTSVFGYLVNTVQSLILLLRYRPRVIVSTGAGIAIAPCLIGKLLASHLIFIETGARIKSPSRTGKFMYKYADTFIVQWEPLLKHYPNAIMGGPLL